MDFPSEFNIAIIGAGPAGCLLGRCLSLSNIKFTIFESDASSEFRSQGGTLDLHKHTGLAAMRAAGLHDEFLRRARYEGEALCITDKNLKKYLELGSSSFWDDGGRPEIDRLVLRAMLLESLPEGTVRWSRHLRSICNDLTLHFDQGNESGFDLIVGADGGWSKTRSFLSEQLPVYTSIAGTEFSISDAAHRFPDLDKLVNRGSLYTYSDGCGLNAQQVGDGRLKVIAWAVEDEDWVKKMNATTMNPKAVKELVAKRYVDWAPELKKLLSAADEEPVVTRAIYMLPIGFKWENKPGVTLIGDAAHLMSPFAGEGANIAMADAMKLAECIKKSTTKIALTKNVAAFEEDMFRRAKPTQELSDANLKGWFFTPGSPESAIDPFMIREATHFGGSMAGALAASYLFVRSRWRKLRD